MTKTLFKPKTYSHFPEKGQVSWKSPSNIALVKYWGKFENQIPANASISFTLDACHTKTQVTFLKKEIPSKTVDFDVIFEGKKATHFKPKIQTFFERIVSYLPFLTTYYFEIHTQNTFPHSSGIASSASGFSALALCLVDIESQLDQDCNLHTQNVISNNNHLTSYQKQKASFLARLGSGSACRSIEGPLVVWGEHAGIKGSSNLFGIQYPFKIHPVFTQFLDTILLVDIGEKKVSSSVGHSLMKQHPFAKQRFTQANNNLQKLIPIFEKGDLEAFISLVEHEALTLHAMMMTSNPYFILMQPQTLEIINKIWDFRAQTKTPICFTLDAGANVHVLYPQAFKEKAIDFIKNQLVKHCYKGQYICDQIGFGSKKC
jgi:diphosphomevalonate decarboxylase